MLKRRMALAAGMAVTVTLGLTTALGAAPATAAVHARTAAGTLQVTITDGKSMTVSATGLHAGQVPLAVTAKGAEGIASVMSLHSGYTLKNAKADLKKFGEAFGPGGDMQAGLKAFRHLLAHITLYGGIDSSKGTTRRGTLLLPSAGTYYVWNSSGDLPAQPTKITVGAASGPQTLPATDSTVTATTNKRFSGPTTLLRKGSVTFRNTSTESPHLFSLAHVKDGTTRQQVIDSFSSNNPPDFVRAGQIGTDAISNGQAMTLNYSLPAGEYAEMCFFPDPQTGEPHAMMGMVRMVRLVDAQTVQARISDSSFSVFRAPHLHAGRVHLQLAAIGGERTAGVLRLHSGYTLKDLQADLKAFGDSAQSGQPSKSALKHLRHAIANTTLYGGVDTDKGTTRTATFVLAPGTYYVENSSDGAPSAFRKFVVGAASGAQTLPKTSATVVAKTNKRFGGDATLPHNGNVTFHNASTESPHFMFLQHVKEGTTRQQVLDSFQSQSQGPPDFVLPGLEGTDALSSNQSQVIHLNLPRGEYALMCFFPDPQDGTPHAFMGMVRIVHLK